MARSPPRELSRPSPPNEELDGRPYPPLPIAGRRFTVHHNRRISRPHSAVRSRRWFAQRPATRRPRSRRPVPAQAPTALRPPLMQDKAVQIEASVSSVAVARCPEPLFRERRRPPRWLPRFPRSARRQRLAGFERPQADPPRRGQLHCLRRRANKSSCSGTN